ncbi:MAG: hypothetical protein E6I52_06235 [Chloroflexi bacterium]|nr:MAG: hypothetical protein E6I52_06235 [Chloroflexota bacterium]
MYRRLELLTRVSEILASSLDYEATLRQVAWLAVSELADWCAVHLVDTVTNGRGDIVGALGMFSDITERKRAEAERDRLAGANAVLIDELQRALGVREELLAATSHELRTPLAHIKGFTSSLRQPDVEWDEATRQDFLAEIEREADRLSGLIGDLLSMSRLESGVAQQHPRTETAPDALVSAGLDRVRGLLGDARLRVDVPPNLPPVLVDAAQLEQVVANLVENAAKYGPSNVEIGVTAPQIGSELELAVEDDGPGIPDDDLGRRPKTSIRMLCACRLPRASLSQSVSSTSSSGPAPPSSLACPALASDWQSAAPSSRPTADGCGRRTDPWVARAWWCVCPSNPPTHEDRDELCPTGDSGDRRRGAHAQVRGHESQGPRLSRAAGCQRSRSARACGQDARRPAAAGHRSAWT